MVEAQKSKENQRKEVECVTMLKTEQNRFGNASVPSGIKAWQNEQMWRRHIGLWEPVKVIKL